MKPKKNTGKQADYDIPLITFARNMNEHVLSIFSLPKENGNDKCNPLATNALLKSSYRRRKSSATKKPLELLPAIHPMLRSGNALEFIEKELDTSSFSDIDAECIACYLQKYSSIREPVLDALTNWLRTTVKKISWNQHPNEHPEWNHDLRFYGEWWLTLRSTDSIGAQKARAILNIPENESYTCLLSSSERLQDQDLQNQLISDLVLRLHGPLYHLTLMHFDCFDMTPSRMHVLFFDGIVPLKRYLHVDCLKDKKGSFRDKQEVIHSGSFLETLSFSNCNIGSAALIILLFALTEDHIKGCTINLDLSCNALNNSSLGCFTALLCRTKVRRLDLRHNLLYARTCADFVTFLSEGCRDLKELSLCATGLSPAQIRGLFHVLPEMHHLRSLLLNYLDIPLEMAMEIHSAVRKSRLHYISLTGCGVSQHPTLVKELVECCTRNRRWEEFTPNPNFNSSFFESLSKKMKLKGWTALQSPAFINDLRPYTSNDPSLCGLTDPMARKCV